MDTISQGATIEAFGAQAGLHGDWDAQDALDCEAENLAARAATTRRVGDFLNGYDADGGMVGFVDTTGAVPPAFWGWAPVSDPNAVNFCPHCRRLLVKDEGGAAGDYWVCEGQGDAIRPCAYQRPAVLPSPRLPLSAYHGAARQPAMAGDRCRKCGHPVHTEMGKRGPVAYCNECAWNAPAKRDVWTDADVRRAFGEAVN